MWSRITISICLAAVVVSPLWAAELININTATLAELDSLPGVGPTTAQSIIDNRPYASIEEVSRANGIGEPGSSSYENIKNLITVDSSSPTQTDTQTQAQTQTETQTTQPSSGSANPPPALRAEIVGSVRAAAGAGAVYSGEAYNQGGELLETHVRYIWNFGDGATAEGRRVLHTYHYPGQYSIELTVAYNYSSASARQTVQVVAPAVALVAEGDGSLTVYNRGTTDLDIGLWSLREASTTFVVPENTVVLVGGGVRFAAAVTALKGGRDAVLYYPNGTQAATAGVGASSPLRGERVSGAGIVGEGASQARLAPRLSNSSADEYAYPEPADSGASVDHSALASASAAGSVPGWSIWAALVAVLGIGAAGAYYAGVQGRRPETSPSPEEFDIDDDQ